MTLRQIPLTVPEQIQDIYEQLRRRHPSVSLQEIATIIGDHPCDCGCTTFPGSKSFFEAGIIAVETSNEIWYPPFPLTIRSVRATVKTSTGENIVDINVNGTTIFTDQTHRPTIPSASTTALASLIDLPIMNLNDYLTFDVDEGNGSDLSIEIGYVVECDALGVPTQGTSSPPPQCLEHYVLADTPIRYYRLDELSGTTAIDQMGNFNATYQDTPTLNEPSLITCDSDPSIFCTTSGGGARQDRIYAADNPALTAFSIEFWIQKHGSSHFIFDNGDAFSGTIATMWTYIDSSSRIVWRAPGALAIIGNTVPDDVPVHIMATAISSGAAHIYINGVDQGTTTCGAFTHFAPSGHWLFGAGSKDNFSLGDFQGYLDEIAIYDYVLSPSQVLAHYRAGTS